jgi:hypothetical protein
MAWERVRDYVTAPTYLRHPITSHEAANLNILHSRCKEPFDQLPLHLGGYRWRGDVLQSISWRDLDDSTELISTSTARRALGIGARHPI